jgi:hypothetical protein
MVVAVAPPDALLLAAAAGPALLPAVLLLLPPAACGCCVCCARLESRASRRCFSASLSKVLSGVTLPAAAMTSGNGGHPWQ